MQEVKTRMMEVRPAPSVAEMVDAAFTWWRGAGVDLEFHDEPADWFAAPLLETRSAEPPPATVPPAAARAIAPPDAPPIDLSAMPAELPAWRQWWLADPSLDQGRTAGRVPPRGEAGAAVMILVPQPEAEDTATLLSGPQGRLIASMVAAMGYPQEAVYFASALVRHTPHADWAGLAAAGMGTALSRHVALARPGRLIVLGGNILPLLGHDLPLSAHPSRTFNHEGGTIPVLVARDPETLERASAKARFWHDWLAWSDAG